MCKFSYANFTSFVHMSQKLNGRSVFRFLKSFCIVICNRSTWLHSHDQCISVLSFPHPLQNLLFSSLLINNHNRGKVKPHVVFSYTSLIAIYSEHFLMCLLLTICITYFEKYLSISMSFAHFLLGRFCCLLNFYRPWISIHYQLRSSQIFSPSILAAFHSGLLCYK